MQVAFELFFNTYRLNPVFRCAYGGKGHSRQ